MDDITPIIDLIITPNALFVRDITGCFYCSRHLIFSKQDGLATVAPLPSTGRGLVNGTIPERVKAVFQDAYRNQGLEIPIVFNNEVFYTLEGIIMV